MLPSIASSGLALLARGGERLAASARTFTRSADGTDAATDDPSSATADPVGAAVGVVYGRTDFAAGVALLRIGRDTEQALVDMLA